MQPGVALGPLSQTKDPGNPLPAPSEPSPGFQPRHSRGSSPVDEAALLLQVTSQHLDKPQEEAGDKEGCPTQNGLFAVPFPPDRPRGKDESCSARTSAILNTRTTLFLSNSKYKVNREKTRWRIRRRDRDRRRDKAFSQN